MTPLFIHQQDKTEVTKSEDWCYLVITQEDNTGEDHSIYISMIFK
jgi:hypothetical protein